MNKNDCGVFNYNLQTARICAMKINLKGMGVGVGGGGMLRTSYSITLSLKILGPSNVITRRRDVIHL